MHTATRLAVPRIEAARRLNPAARICCYGLYAPMNEPLLRSFGDQQFSAGNSKRALTELGFPGVTISGDPTSGNFRS